MAVRLTKKSRLKSGQIPICRELSLLFFLTFLVFRIHKMLLINAI